MVISIVAVSTVAVVHAVAVAVVLAYALHSHRSSRPLSWHIESGNCLGRFAVAAAVAVAAAAAAVVVNASNMLMWSCRSCRYRVQGARLAVDCDKPPVMALCCNDWHNRISVRSSNVSVAGWRC